MLPSTAIVQSREAILRTARAHGASQVRVFGSAIHEAATENSDLDLLITLENGRSLLDMIAIKQELEDVLGFRVDVLTEAALSPYMCDSVLKEAVLL